MLFRTEIRFAPSFVEAAVLEVADCTFFQERSALYELKDPTMRERAFRELAHRYFHSMDLAELFSARSREFPIVSESVELIVVREVHTAKEEGMDLYRAGPDGREVPGVVSRAARVGIRPIRCRDRESLLSFLRYEWMHLSDILDPAFAYDPHQSTGRTNPLEDGLVRERFGALWSLWVSARMEKRWPESKPLAMSLELEKPLSLLPQREREALVRRVQEGRPWTQIDLLRMADDGNTLSGGGREGLHRESPGSRPVRQLNDQLVSLD